MRLANRLEGIEPRSASTKAFWAKSKPPVLLVVRINIVKKKNKISRDLLSKIEWACRLSSIKFEHQMILEGCLRVIEHTNLAYVEPHRVIIKNNLYLFFNEHDYFYVGDLKTKYPLSKLQEYIARH